MACLEVDYGAEPSDEGLEEEADYGEDEREDDAEIEEGGSGATGGDGSNSGATCASASDSTPAPPQDCSEAAARGSDELPCPVVEELAADGFHSGGSSSSTAAAPDRLENCASSEDAPSGVAAELLRETARPLAPGNPRPESSGNAAPPSPEWQPPWKLGQAPWQQRSSEPSRPSRPPIGSFPAAQVPWHRKQPTHMPPYVPKNGVPPRPPFTYAPRLTDVVPRLIARPPPPFQTRSGPYVRADLRDLSVSNPSSSEEKVPHKAAPKSMKLRLAKAKSGRAPPKSPPAVAAPVPCAPPSPTWREVLGISSAPPKARSRSRSPRVNTSPVARPACENLHEVSLSSEEEEDDKREGNSAVCQRETAIQHSHDCLPAVHEMEEADAGDEGADGADALVQDEEGSDVAHAATGAAETAEADDGAEKEEEEDMQLVGADGAQIGMAAFFAEAYQQVVAADAAEEGVAEDFEVAEVNAAEAHPEPNAEALESLDEQSLRARQKMLLQQKKQAIESEEFEEAAKLREALKTVEARLQELSSAPPAAEDDCAEIDLAQVEAEVAAYEEQAGADQGAVEASETDVQNLDMSYPPEWLVAEGALERVPELHEDGLHDSDACQEHAEVCCEQVEMPEALDEPMLEATAPEAQEGLDAPQLHQMDQEEDEEEEEVVEIVDEEEDEELEEGEVVEEEDDGEDKMDVEAEALLRAEALRMQNSMVAGEEDEDSEEFFVDIAGSDARSGGVPSKAQVATHAAPAMKSLRPTGAGRSRQVDLQQPPHVSVFPAPRQAPKAAPWNRPRPPSFRGVSASTGRRR